jgi:Ser/Thr protein kinase RdoA (MazF antagonist)
MPQEPPADRILDLFAAEGVLEPLAGGQGTTWRAGDLVLSPVDGSAQIAWLAPVQARLAVRLDEMVPRSVRLALPVPARDGSLVADGWAATRFEPGTTPCRELAVLRATAHLLHAHLASAVPERLAYDGAAAALAAQERSEPGLPDLVDRLVAGLDGTDLGREQLVHADLAGNVLLDATGVPFVIDFSPAWRSPLWAEAVCVLDAVLWLGAPAGAMDDWRTGDRRQAMLRAALFRVLSDRPCNVPRYAALGLA